MVCRTYQTHTPKVDPDAWVDESAVVIGNVTIARDASLWPMCVARGDIGTIEIGAATNVQDGSVLHITAKSEFSPGCNLTIGAEVTIGHAAVIHACTIEDLCLIGMNATVLDGAVVESHAMVAAHALVPPGKRVTGKFLWAGVPVKKIRPLTDTELKFLKFSAEHYVQLKNLHQSGDSD